MRHSLPRRSRLVVGLALLALIATACVKQNKPGLAIKSLKSNIVFGINPPSPPETVPQTNYDITQPNLPALPNNSLPPFPRKPDLPCPPATRSEVAQSLATTGVPVTPKPGTYRWKVTGKQHLYGVDVAIPQIFVNRTIFNVSKVSETTTPVGGSAPGQPITTRTFTYDQKTDLSVPGVESFSEVDSFQVKDNPLAVNAFAVSNGVPAVGGGIGKPVIVGDPVRGLALMKQAILDPGGHQIATFNWNPGVLLLPLPVNTGEQYQSVSIDPATGSVIVNDVTVGARTLVDACGKLVQGWNVTSRQYLTGVNQSDPTSSFVVAGEYDYVVATQMGAMLVYEKNAPPPPNVPLPTVPVIPGLPPLPGGVVQFPPTVPPLPVPLPGGLNTVELTLAQIQTS